MNNYHTNLNSHINNVIISDSHSINVFTDRINPSYTVPMYTHSANSIYSYVHVYGIGHKKIGLLAFSCK